MNGISEKPILDLVSLITATLKMPIAAIALKKNGIVYARLSNSAKILELDDKISFSGLVFEAKKNVEFPDTHLDPKAKTICESRPELGARFYYGHPLLDLKGEVLGVLSIVDTEPRVLTEAERETIVGLVGIAECVLRSLTVERELEEALRKARSNEAALMTIFQALPLAVLSKDVRSGNFEFLFWNKEAERMFGAKAADVIGKTDYDIGSKTEADFFRKKDLESMLSRKVVEIPDEPRTGAGGVQISLRSIKIPIYDESGKPEFLIVVCEDITDKKKQAALAAEASRLKSDFLANMSHEIRTPLNGVVGMIEALKETSLDAKQKEHLEILNSCSESLLLMMNDILDLTKLEAGRMKLSEHSFAPTEVLKSVGKNFKFEAFQKGLEFKFNIDPNMPQWIVGDSVRIRQALMNLVGNAIKFTSQGSVIVDITWSEPGRLRCKVKDTGIGISPVIQSRLFQTFSQADSSITKEYRGAGLGLSMSKNLVELMGGDIGLISSEGQGSEFWFEVLCPEDKLQSIAEHKKSKIVSKGLGKGARVLIVEDNVLNRRIVTSILATENYQIDYAINGQQACEKFNAEAYDIILMDCQMPIMSGYEATERIRAAESLRGTRTPIIAITANAMDGDREKCLAVGMDDYIAKPIRKQHFLETLQRWLEKK